MYLDLGLDILDGIRGLHLQGDGLPRQGLDKDLHVADDSCVRSVRLLALDWGQPGQPLGRQGVNASGGGNSASYWSLRYHLAL